MAPNRKNNTDNGNKIKIVMHDCNDQINTNLIITKIDNNIRSHNNITPTEILSAANGFSEGTKRHLTTVVTGNDSEKKQCVHFNDCSSKNNVFDVEITKSQQTNSVSSISGLTQVIDFAAKPTINQCSESWIQMQHSIQMEENQNKKRIEMYFKHHLFKKVKFISSQKQMIYSSKKSSISY